MQEEGAANSGEGGSGTREERCAGRGRREVGRRTGPGGSRPRPLPAARRRGLPPRLSLSVCIARDPLLGATEASTAVSSCTELRHVQMPGELPAGGGIGAGAVAPPTLRAAPPRPRGFGHLEMGEEWERKGRDKRGLGAVGR